jgi:hypothetical protein
LDLLPRGSVGAEIGVHHGDFSAAILEAVAPRLLHLIDPWKHEAAPEYSAAWYGGRASGAQAEMDERHDGVVARFAAEIARGQVIVHRSTSDVALAELADSSLDWVYIDGNHRYEFVVEDLELSLAKTRSGGLVTGDDYAEGGWWEGGVKRAVDELAASGRARLVTIRDRQFVFERP